MELIPILGRQPTGDMSHKPGGRLPSLLFSRPAVTLATLKRAATSFAAWWTGTRWVWTVLPKTVTWQRCGCDLNPGPSAPESNTWLPSYPLRVCSAVQRHKSAERPILHQISSLMYPKIQRRQVIMNVRHPSCAQPPRWSPPVLWRSFADGLASICVLIHLCKMPKDSETTGLNDGWKWWLVGSATDVSISDKVSVIAPSSVNFSRQLIDPLSITAIGWCVAWPAGFLTHFPPLLLADVLRDLLVFDRISVSVIGWCVAWPVGFLTHFPSLLLADVSLDLWVSWPTFHHCYWPMCCLTCGCLDDDTWVNLRFILIN